MKSQNANVKIQKQGPDEPLGDRGQGDTSWTPDSGEQGISNRAGDEDADDADEFEDDTDVEDVDDSEATR